MLFVTFCAVSAALPVAGQQLTLDEALSRALVANRMLKVAALDAAKLEEKRSSLKTELLPQARFFALAAQPLNPFSFTIERGALGFDSGGALLPTSDAKLQNSVRPIGVAALAITQPLSLIPSIRRGVRIADIQREIATEQLRLARQQLVRDVRVLFQGIEGAENGLKAAEEGVRLSQEVVRISAEYVAKREVLDVDYLQAQMQLAKYNENVLEFENERDDLKARLNQKMGRDVLTEFAIAVTSEDAPSAGIADDAAEARARALEQRPEVRQARLKLQAAKLGLENAAASFHPTIAAELIGVELADINPLLPRQIGFAGLSFNWQPVTWGRRKHELADKRYEIEQAEMLEKEAEDQVRVEVTEHLRRLRLAQTKLRVADLGRQMAEESLRISQRRYEAEYSLLKTVLDAQATREAANADYRRTLNELSLERAEYARAMGEDR
jgi:outer membrane protein TolC